MNPARTPEPSPPASGSARTRRGPGRPKAGSENKRERILREAVALFGGRGYSGTSLADIAAAADISKAGLLHHFSSKEELFIKVLERWDSESLAGSAGPEDALDPWVLLDNWLLLMERHIRRRDLVAIYSATAPSVLDVSHPAHHWMVEHLVRAITRFAEAFERGKEAGTVRPEMPSVAVARSLTALSDGLRLQWLCATTPDNGAKAVLDTDMVGEMRLYVESLKALWRLGPTGTCAP